MVVCVGGLILSVVIKVFRAADEVELLESCRVLNTLICGEWARCDGEQWQNCSDDMFYL
jgi:hypothetical protein